MTGNEKAMETLMEQGRAHGKLATTEINDVMEKLDLDVDQIEFLLRRLPEHEH